MKNNLLATCRAALAVATGVSCHAAPPPGAAVAPGVAQRVVSVALFCPGTPRANVEAALGPPTYNMENDLYVYLNYRSTNEAVSRAGFTAMLVVFTRNHVSLLKFVNPDDLRAQLAAGTGAARLCEPLHTAPR